MKWILGAALLLIVMPKVALAACASPTGNAGEMTYNVDYSTMQFCNGTSWISMAAGGATESSGGVPSGAVLAFNLSSCPSGWTEYTAARGRFIRGIDSTGTNDPDGVRSLGSTQADAFQTHTHSMPAGGNVGSGGSLGTGFSALGYGTPSSGSPNSGTTTTETRPKNVALLYCQKS